MTTTQGLLPVGHSALKTLDIMQVNAHTPLVGPNSFRQCEDSAAATRRLFADRLNDHGQRVALISDDGEQTTYAELASAVESLSAELATHRRLILLEAANHRDCVVAYLACLRARLPIVLCEPGSNEKDNRIARTFAAAERFGLLPDGSWGFEALSNDSLPESHPDLCILLSTSGTTGSPKLVMLSAANIEANAASIATYLNIQTDDRAITSLPPFYSYGMSVINSHLYAGATILLSGDSLVSEQFWRLFEDGKATSLAAVPYTFDVLEKMHFRDKHYPHLKTITQAGGRLEPERVIDYARWAKAQGKSFVVMYGQTEAAPRMAYVPPELLETNTECIGLAIPGGTIELVDDAGVVIDTSDRPGELVYRGPNVMMGYAEQASDLALGPRLEHLSTGDIACRKSNGLFYIVGRTSRFSKIVGLRINLDEIERWLHLQGWHGIVSGDDSVICIAHQGQGEQASIANAVSRRFGLPNSAIEVLDFEEIPTLPSGKYDYRKVLQMCKATAANGKFPGDKTLLESYCEILRTKDIRLSDSFVDLNGDSVSFVDLSLAIEKRLGFVPDNWEAASIASLEQLSDGGKIAGTDSMPLSSMSGRNHRSLAALLLIAMLFVAGEVALQARSYWKTGRSAAALVTGQSTTVVDPESGVKTYRPNLVIENSNGRGGKFSINSSGFRSPEISRELMHGEIRIAVVGASTVAGAYAKTNDDTFPSLLEKNLRKAMPNETINVINAGIEGYTLNDVDRLIEHVLIPFKPSVTVVYPGFNDMAGICSSARKNGKEKIGLAKPVLPGWVLTRDMISKNTVTFREPPVRARAIDPRAYFPVNYADTLKSIAGRLSRANSRPIFVTVARAFKNAGMDERLELAKTALFYNSCLDIGGLIQAGELFNDVVRKVAVENGIPLIDLAEELPGGERYFVDAGHFTFEGERFTANVLLEAIFKKHLISPRSMDDL